MIRNFMFMLTRKAYVERNRGKKKYYELSNFHYEVSW